MKGIRALGGGKRFAERPGTISLIADAALSGIMIDQSTWREAEYLRPRVFQES
jgi:hypothetical protein